MLQVAKIIQCKCPSCEQGNVFEKSNRLNFLKFAEMKKSCDVCGVKYEKEPGFFYGSMYVSYGLGVWEGILIYALCHLFLSDPFDLRILFTIIASQILFRAENYRYSRMIWIYMFADKNEKKELENNLEKTIQ